ncbi:MAG: Smr/MutS family protein, partial [Bacteroidales bacterium]
METTIIASQKEHIFEVGTLVCIKGQNTVGEIAKLNDNGTAMIAIGNLYLSIALQNLSPANRAEQKARTQTAEKSSTTTMSLKRLNFSTNIDVRGMRTEEALAEVEILLDQALMFGESELRILHGKGTGTLKQEIRKYLKTIRSVANFTDESEQHGGAGITIIKLR